MITRAVYGFIDLLLPPICPMSGEVVDREAMLSAESWSKLSFQSSSQCSICGRSMNADYHVSTFFKNEAASKALICPSCTKDRPSFDKHRSALIYNNASKSLILGFKHADFLHYCNIFTPWMISAIKPFADEIDVIIPVPLHYTRLLSRRYNQAALLAYNIAKQSGKKQCYEPLLIKRHRHTRSQGHMNKSQREKNVKAAFTLTPKAKAKLEGRNVLIVDDVYTTGATLNACARTLREHSRPNKIYAVSIAQTQYDG
jgi:ComF family protein